MPIISLLSIRNMKRQKTRTICLFIAIVISTFLISVVSVLSESLQQSYGDYIKSNRLWQGDVAINVYSDKEVSSISDSELVKDVGCEYHLGYVIADGDAVANVAYYSSDMYEKMNCEPMEGEVPTEKKDIYLPKYIAEKAWPNCKVGSEITLAYSIGNESVSDTFTISGFYEQKVGSRNMFLVSEKYYDEKKQEFSEKGIDDSEFPIMLAVSFKEHKNFEELTQKLLSEEGIHTTEYTVNEEVTDSLEKGIRILECIILSVLAIIGSLLIVDIYELSLNNDRIYYRSLYILGVSKREIVRMILIQMVAIAVVANIIAAGLACVSCNYLLVPLINRLINLELQMSISKGALIYPVLISLLEVVLGLLLMLRHINRQINITGKTRKIKYKKRTGRKFSNPLFRMTLRRVGTQKRAVFGISFLLFLGIVLCNGICSYIKGFDIDQYIGESLQADYVVHNASFDAMSDQLAVIEESALSTLFNTEKEFEYASASAKEYQVKLDEESTLKYRELLPEGQYKDGLITTYLYGLDDYFVSKMDVIKGEIDLDKFNSGNYVILDGVCAPEAGMETEQGKSWWNIGDKVSLTASDGSVKEYEIMAYADLPYDLGVGSYYYETCNFFLPESEWENLTGETGRYICLFNVNKNDLPYWEETFHTLSKTNDSIKYESARTIAEDNKDLFRNIEVIVVMIILIIIASVLGGFFNIIINEMYQLKNELINLKKIGVSERELVVQFVFEVFIYICTGIVLGIVLSPVLVRTFINDVIAEDYVTYRLVYSIDAVYIFMGIVIMFGAVMMYKRNVISKRAKH